MATWYVKLYHSNGTEELSRQLRDFASVRQFILDVRKAGFRDTVRVLVPDDASPDEIQQLRDLGIELV
jgi:hypothetical protein